LYGYLIKISRQYNIDLSRNFKELEKFFKYIELSQAINPLELVREEQEFKDEINDRFSENKAEEEVTFLSNFIRYYEEYLTGKITAEDYKYYKKNADKFKYVWVKYIDNREIAALEEYEKISDEFYRINMARNEYFMENMKEVIRGKKIEKEAEGTDELQKSMNSLKGAKEIYITITGGFHTQAIAEMLTKEQITNMVITPNVKGETKKAQETYNKIAQEQAKIAFQALAPWLTSQNPDRNKLIDFFQAAEQINLESREIQKSINEVVEELKKEGNKELEVELVGKNKIKINGKEYTKEGLEEEKEDKNSGMQKSVSSIRETLKATWLLSIGFLTVTAVLIPVFIVTGSIPVVAFAIGESVSALGTIFFFSSLILKNRETAFLNKAKKAVY
jgi:hypothetical protein